MLKNLLKTLIESVFTNKREWISAQTKPYSIYSVSDDTGTGQYKDSISPIDGWLTVQLDSYASSDNRVRVVIKSPDDRDMVASSTDRTATGVGTVFIPVRKGASVSIYVGSGISYWYRYATDQSAT